MGAEAKLFLLQIVTIVWDLPCFFTLVANNSLNPFPYPSISNTGFHLSLFQIIFFMMIYCYHGCLVPHGNIVWICGIPKPWGRKFTWKLQLIEKISSHLDFATTWLWVVRYLIDYEDFTTTWLWNEGALALLS